MRNDQKKISGLFSLAIAILIIAGCAAPQVQMSGKIYPVSDKTSASQSLSVLRLRGQEAVSFKANGQCLSQFVIDGKPHKENFNVKLWVNPPAEIRLHGDIAFNSRGLDIGANTEDFWIAMKPKEIGNSYFWGDSSDRMGVDDFAIRPQILLEAMGMIKVDSEESLTLENKGGFDVLTNCNEEGAIIKKIYINSGDDRVRKIEYFGQDRQIAITIQLANYKEISNGFAVPTTIGIVKVDDDGKENSFKITLGSVRTEEFSWKKRQVLFNRPQPRGFEHVYQIINGQIVEQR